MTITVQVLMSPECGHGTRTLELLREVLAQMAPSAMMKTVIAATTEDADRLGFPGSPTVRVNGKDIDPNQPRRVGLG